MLVSIYLIHNNEALFPNARSFDPDRFAGSKPDTYQWIPFGGGVRRCIILVGPDAYVFDALARVAPTRYYNVVAGLEKRLRSRQAARR